MKGKVAALLIGLVLGSTATAAATTTVYWRHVGNTYVCRGLDSFVYCRARNWKPGYEVGVDGKSADVIFGGHVIFTCKYRYYPAQCDDFR